MPPPRVPLTMDASTPDERAVATFAKVPEVTLVFWLVKIAATTLGETGGDAVTMSWLGETAPGASGMGYLIGTGIFGALFAAAAWAQVRAPRFHPAPYWFAIIASTTVGTTLADYVTRALGLGYAGAMALFGGALAVVAALYFRTRLSRTLLFWVAFILTRPLGAVVGDFLDKPVARGGLELSRYSASAVLLVFILGCIVLFPQRAAARAH